MELLENETTINTKPLLMGLVVLKLVERGSSTEADFEETKPFSVLCGDYDQLATIGKDILQNIDFVTSPERDYYLFSITHDNIDYTFGPGDALLIYADGSIKGIVDQSPEDLERIWEVLSGNCA